MGMLPNYLKTLPSTGTKIGKTNFPSKNTAKWLYGYLIYLLKNDPTNIVISTSYRLLTAANRTTVRRYRCRQLVTKWVETVRPKLGFFHILLSSKGGNIAFLPHPSVQYCAHVLAINRKQQTSQLWLEWTGEGCRFFCSRKLPYLSTMSQQFCS